MINMDMIGRIRDGKVYVGGAGTRIEPAGDGRRGRCPSINLNIDFSDTTGYGSSDHTSFTAKQVPVLFFFSGLHADYHKPSDTWDKIDAPGAVEAAGAGSRHRRPAAGGGRAAAVRPGERTAARTAAASGIVERRRRIGLWAVFRQHSGFRRTPQGREIRRRARGSPAAKAGLKGGDMMVEFDGKKIQNLYDFTYALRAKKPGDEVMVKVLRGTETIEVKVLLEARK